MKHSRMGTDDMMLAARLDGGLRWWPADTAAHGAAL
jgi:hypothetical protein